MSTEHEAVLPCRMESIKVLPYHSPGLLRSRHPILIQACSNLSFWEGKLWSTTRSHAISCAQHPWSGTAGSMSCSCCSNLSNWPWYQPICWKPLETRTRQFLAFGTSNHEPKKTFLGYLGYEWVAWGWLVLGAWVSRIWQTRPNTGIFGSLGGGIHLEHHWVKPPRSTVSLSWRERCRPSQSCSWDTWPAGSVAGAPVCSLSWSRTTITRVMFTSPLSSNVF